MSYYSPLSFCAVYLMDTFILPSILPQNAACEHTDTTVELDGEGESVYVPAADSHCTQHLQEKQEGKVS